MHAVPRPLPFHFAFLVAVALSAVGADADADAPGRGKLLAKDDFARKTEAPAPTAADRHPAGWKFAIGRWEVADGALSGVAQPADHHPAHAIYNLPYRDVVVECEVRLDDCTMTRIRAADHDYVWSVRMTPGGFSVYKDDHDHDGPDKDVLLARVAMPVTPGTWYPLTITARGDEVTATFAGRTASGTHANLGIPKASLRFAVVGGGARYRKLRVWQAATAAAAVRHRVLGADRGKVSLLDLDGSVAWDYPVKGTPHDLARLPGGNVLVITGAATVVEVAPDRSVVWQYTARPKAPYTGPVEVHACQRLDDGLTMIAETGNRRIVEVDRDGRIVREVPLTVDKPHPHRDTRRARKLASGHYLVCHEGDGVVREYDATGKVVWSYALDLAGRPRTPGHAGHGAEVFSALRTAEGHTLIATGNGNRVIEVDPAGKVVWSLEEDELPGIRLQWVTTLEQRPNGHLLIGNCHAGPDNPQLIEVTREKKAVWTLKDFTTFGNDLASAIVIDDEITGTDR